CFNSTLIMSQVCRVMSRLGRIPVPFRGIVTNLKRDESSLIITKSKSSGPPLINGHSPRIRQAMLDADVIEAVVGLAPNLFYGAGIPAAVLVCRKARPAERRANPGHSDTG